MHSIVQRPMVVSGKIEARPMMYVALTYDHRLVDGREVRICAGFGILNYFVEMCRASAATTADANLAFRYALLRSRPMEQ
eukprot:1156198-Pelagomonas_calceolata.AAC.9